MLDKHYKRWIYPIYCCTNQNFPWFWNVPITDKNAIEKYWRKHWMALIQNDTVCMDTLWAVWGEKLQIIRYSNLCHSICQSLNVMPPSLHHSSVPQGHRAITLDHMSQSAGDWYISPKYWERLSSHAIWQDFVLWLCKLKRVFRVSCFVRYDDRGKEKSKRETGSCTLQKTLECL